MTSMDDIYGLHLWTTFTDYIDHARPLTTRILSVSWTIVFLSFSWPFWTMSSDPGPVIDWYLIDRTSIGEALSICVNQSIY